jgi:hypothetical protein
LESFFNTRREIFDRYEGPANHNCEIPADNRNIDNVLKSMDIHTNYIIRFDSPILWIRNIWMIATLTILSKIYLNQIDSRAPFINMWHGVIAILLLAAIYYFHEGIFNFWQACHLNRMNKLDKGVRKSLFKGKEKILTGTYEYKESVHKATKEEKLRRKLICTFKYIFCPKERPSSFFFYVLVAGASSVLTWLITSYVN